MKEEEEEVEEEEAEEGVGVVEAPAKMKKSITRMGAWGV